MRLSHPLEIELICRSQYGEYTFRKTMESNVRWEFLQAIAQPISDIYEEIFSDYSYGFRPGRSCHDAIRQALCYLNDGYEWVVDIDIQILYVAQNLLIN